MSKQPQSDSWCFTQFVKFNERDQEYVPRILWNEEAMVYLIYQLEECPKSGRLHWQGYIQFKNRVRMQRVKQLLDLDNVHLEIARGNDVQNRFYCSKSESRIDGPWEFGVRDERKGQGKRNDIRDFLNLAKNEGFGAAVRNNPEVYVKYGKGLTDAYNWIREPVEREPPKVIWIYGPTGVGKSKEARRKDKRAFAVPKVNHGKLWFGSYTDQKTIILDDLRPDRIDNDTLLVLLDRYEQEVEIKGGFRWLNAETIYITSDRSPEEFWDPESDLYYSQFMRRINKVIRIDESGEKFREK